MLRRLTPRVITQFNTWRVASSKQRVANPKVQYHFFHLSQMPKFVVLEKTYPQCNQTVQDVDYLPGNKNCRLALHCWGTVDFGVRPCATRNHRSCTPSTGHSPPPCKAFRYTPCKMFANILTFVSFSQQFLLNGSECVFCCFLYGVIEATVKHWLFTCNRVKAIK